MWPIIIQFGPFTVYSYGLSLAIAAVVCATLLAKDAQQQGLSKGFIYDLMFYLVLAGIIGARLFYVFLAWDYYQDNWREIFLITQGGLAWQGGFLGAVVMGIVIARLRKVPLRTVFDLAAPYIALGQAIGRLGCFANGCCYGKPVSWGVYFPAHHARLHPTQLYEALSLFVIFILLKWVVQPWGAGCGLRGKAKPGMVFVAYLCLASMERFVVEFFRADQMAFVGSLSLFQWISLVVFLVGVSVLLLTQFIKVSR